MRSGRTSGAGASLPPAISSQALLDRIGVAREEVRPWRYSGRAPSPPARSRAIANAMAAPTFSHKWETLRPAERRLRGIRVAELPDSAAEAQAIALALREALETPGKTAALVTPDRLLAKRVVGLLARGESKLTTAPGRHYRKPRPGPCCSGSRRPRPRNWPRCRCSRSPSTRWSAGKATSGWRGWTLSGRSTSSFAARVRRPAWRDSIRCSKAASGSRRASRIAAGRRAAERAAAARSVRRRLVAVTQQALRGTLRGAGPPAGWQPSC